MRAAIFLTAIFAIFVMSCGGAAGQVPGPAVPQPVQVDFAIHGEEAAPPDEPRATRDQPPEVKLKLGHYRSPRFGIGLVIDRTEDHAKVRFDGTEQTIRLFPQYFWHRTEYHRARNEKVLEIRSDGRVVLYLEGAGEGIRVFRDGDADPL